MKAQSKGIFIMILSALSTCTGQLMWKLSSINKESLVYMIFGFVFYGVGACLMIVAFQYGEVSVLQPMLSIGFVFSLLLAAIILHETINFSKVIGILMIISGMSFLGRSGKDKKE